ncbi:Enhancer of polycomb-like protein 1 [Ceratobasidium sp. 414]|nr:Enhancer of polycomb-like protein 1 [Ceratobasidium sp. 414]
MRGNAATGYGTKSRSKPRLTNKLKLAVHHGDIDADQPALDDDDDKNKVSSTAGVDAEDSHEHHLQAVLSAASLRAAGQPRASGSGAYIPTPDATGHVVDWEKHYPPGRWEEPEGYIRFSDTIEETQAGAIAGGCTYYMDEPDAEWLAKNNAELADATRSSPPPSARAPHRSAKARGKEPEALSVTISADEFELVMGILERLTDERYPCLHAVSPTVSLCRSLADLPQDVSVFPAITEFEPTFANRLPASFFPNYRVPDYIPQPPQLLRVLRVIYPHWRERRLEREGRRIIPQINSDETNEGDPYVCFRRRDAKPVRKTRRTDTGSIDRMQSLQNNIRQLQHIVQHVLRREQLKQGRAVEERQVMNHRMQLSEVKRKFPTTPFGMRDDDDVLVDKIVKRPRPEGTNILRLSRRPQYLTAAATADAGPSGPTEMPDPRAVALANRKKVDEFMQRNPQQERWWDDLTDTTYMPLPPPAPPERQLRGVRLRIGRGGRRHVDRRPVSVVNGTGRSEINRLESLQFSMRWPRGEPAPANGEGGSAGGVVVLKLKSGEMVTDDEFERAIVTSERWRYDRDERLEESVDQPIVVDDFADRFILSRLTRHSIEDYELLAGDQSIMQHLVPAQGRASASVLALDAARQRQLELERNPPKPSPTLAAPAITPTTNGTPANPSPEPGAAAPAIGAGTSPSPAPSLLPNPVATPTVTPASRLLQVQAQALAMQQKSRLLIPPVLNLNSTPQQPQPQQIHQGVAIRQSRPSVANGKPLSNGTPPIQRPGSGQGLPGQPGGGLTAGSPVLGAGAGGLAVPPPQQRHGSGSPHDNRGGSPLRPLSGVANGVNGGTNGINGTNGLGVNGFPAAYQQLNPQQRLELKHAFQSQGGVFVPNAVNGITPPIQLTLPQQRPQWNRTTATRPSVVNGAGVQGSPQNGHASPPGQLLSVPQGF